MQDAKAVANYFIARAAEDGVRDLNPRKLQGLVFCAHGWCLGITGKPLLATRLLAGRDGPEIPEVAEAAAGYGTKHVTEPIGDLVSGSGETMELQAPSIPPGCPEEKVLMITWKAYGRLSAFDLSRVTQAPNGPWDLLWNDPERTWSERLPVVMNDAAIRMWFRELAEKNRKQTKAPSVEDTQRILVQPDPDRLRSV